MTETNADRLMALGLFGFELNNARGRCNKLEIVFASGLALVDVVCIVYLRGLGIVRADFQRYLDWAWLDDCLPICIRT